MHFLKRAIPLQQKRDAVCIYARVSSETEFFSVLSSLQLQFLILLLKCPTISAWKRLQLLKAASLIFKVNKTLMHQYNTQKYYII